MAIRWNRAPESDGLAIIGFGVQARSHIEAIERVFKPNGSSLVVKLARVMWCDAPGHD